MIDFEFVERLIQALDNSSLDSVEIERGGTRIRLAKTPASVAAPVAIAGVSAPVVQVASAAAPPTDASTPAPASAEAVTAASNLLEVTSPMVGTFYSSPAPDAPLYTDIGARVSPGETLCIIEAMKLMNELECEVSGTIVEICVENAQPVEFGQVLFRVNPD